MEHKTKVIIIVCSVIVIVLIIGLGLGLGLGLSTGTGAKVKLSTDVVKLSGMKLSGIKLSGIKETFANTSTSPDVINTRICFDMARADAGGLRILDRYDRIVSAGT